MKLRRRRVEESLVQERAKTIRIQCPNLECQRILAVTESCRNRLVRCKGCQMLVRVPERDAANEPVNRGRVAGRAGAGSAAPRDGSS